MSAFSLLVLISYESSWLFILYFKRFKEGIEKKNLEHQQTVDIHAGALAWVSTVNVLIFNKYFFLF